MKSLPSSNLSMIHHGQRGFSVLTGLVKTLLALLVLVVLLISRQAVAADSLPLITNGNFETLADGVPEGWGKVSETISFPAEEGNHFLRLKALEPGKMVMVYRSIPLTAVDKVL